MYIEHIMIQYNMSLISQFHHLTMISGMISYLMMISVMIDIIDITSWYHRYHSVTLVFCKGNCYYFGFAIFILHYWGVSVYVFNHVTSRLVALMLKIFSFKNNNSLSLHYVHCGLHSGDLCSSSYRNFSFLHRVLRKHLTQRGRKIRQVLRC